MTGVGDKRFSTKSLLVGIAAMVVVVAASGAAVLVYLDRSQAGAGEPGPGCREVKPEKFHMDAVSDVSPSGDYLLGSREGDDRVVHDNDKPVRIWPKVSDAFDVSYSDFGAQSRTVDVNSSGDVLGEVQLPIEGTNRLTDTKFLLRDGKINELKPPAGYSDDWDLRLSGLSEDGSVTGTVSGSGSGSGAESSPLRWLPGAYAEPTVLEPLDENVATGEDVNADGVVVGFGYARPDGEEAYEVDKVLAWSPDGERTELPFDTSGFDEADYSLPEIAGDWILLGEYRWKLGSDTKPQKVKPSDTYSGDIGEEMYESGIGGDRSIDANGRVYGIDGAEPVVETGGELKPLPVKPKPESGDGTEYSGSRPTAVSDNGRVVIGEHDYLDYENSTSQSFLWMCGQ